jgi:hypothetical protein
MEYDFCYHIKLGKHIWWQMHFFISVHSSKPQGILDQILDAPLFVLQPY